MSAPHPSVAETFRKLGKQVAISFQPYDDNLTGELWSVNVDCQRVGLGDTLELALADLVSQASRSAQ